MSKIIKFSYRFSKLYSTEGITHAATLLQVIRIDLSDLTQEMRDYDTDFGKYKLPPKGAYLMLIFKAQVVNGGLFTTLRRETPAKLEYYQRSVGDFFIVEIENNLN